MTTADEPRDDGRNQRERMLDGDVYIADDPDLVRESLRALDMTAAYNATPAGESGRRRELLGAFGEGPRSARHSTATTGIG